MIIFDGYQLAAEKEQHLRSRVAALHAHGQQVCIAAIVFSEDASSQLYTRLKKEAAERVGIEYEPNQFSLLDNPELVLDMVKSLNQDKKVTGIIIQKPMKRVWQQFFSRGESGAGQKELTEAYNKWWHSLTSSLAPEKDVDGLHPETLRSIQENTWLEQGRVLPATCQAVLEVIKRLPTEVNTIRIIGKSDLLGIPLYYVLKNQGKDVELLARKDLEERMISGQKLLDADCIVTATGVPGLVTGEMVSSGVALIDVGEPTPDVDRASVAAKAAFLTPVPGGIGPMTIISLLENGVHLVNP